MRAVTHSEDGHWIVVDGRRWRAEDPGLDAELAARLRSHLGRARSQVRTAADEAAQRSARDRVQLAKEGLGERGTAWWELTEAERADRAIERLARLDASAPPPERPRADDQGVGSSSS